jgi:cytochrome b6
MKRLFSQFDSWIQERSRFGTVVEFLRRKQVPSHRYSFWYLFGGVALFFFLIQILTGILLLVYYSPTEATAYQSVGFIMNEASSGWLIRSIHHWSSHLMIASILIHLVSTFFMRAYRRPRELMWITGIAQFFLVLGFAFTGKLLPWDSEAYFATQIGTEIPKSIPIIGEFLVSILRGGEYVSDATLRRLFALHVVILPMGTASLIAFHLILNQVHGTSRPLRYRSSTESISFVPTQLFRDVLVWTAAFAVLLTFALMLPVRLGEIANPLAPAPEGIRPEWYFLTLFQSFRLVPASVFGISGELIVQAVALAIALFLLAIPFLDRKAQREEAGRLIPFIGVCCISYAVISTLLAYLT